MDTLPGTVAHPDRVLGHLRPDLEEVGAAKEKLLTPNLRPVQDLFVEYNNRNGHLENLCGD